MNSTEEWMKEVVDKINDHDMKLDKLTRHDFTCLQADAMKAGRNFAMISIMKCKLVDGQLFDVSHNHNHELFIAQQKMEQAFKDLVISMAAAGIQLYAEEQL